MEVVVTPNETRLIEALSSSSVVSWMKEELKVGDCAIRRKDTKEVVCVIERKTISDLWASFRDHRYEDQKRRLRDLKNDGLQEVVYIIEGALSAETEKRSKSIRACMHSLQSSSGFIVHRTSDIAETVTVLEALLNYHEKGPRDKSAGTPLTVSKMKQKPGDVLAPSLWPLHALTLIPQMSTSKAKALLDHYGSLSALIRDLTSEEGPGIMRVSDIQVPGGRRIGKAIATRLRDSLLAANGGKE